MLVELQPDSPVAAEALATLAFSEGDFATAVRYCHSLSEMVPDRFENWFNLGVAYHKQGNFQKAAHAYRQAATLNPGSLQSHLNLGVAQQELSDLAGARASYEKALEIDPNQAGVLWNLALVMEQQSEKNWAGKLYARIGRDAPEYCDARFRLGYLRLLQGEYQASAEAFQDCLARRSEWPEAWLNSGIAFARSSRPADARRCFEETLMLRPDSSDAVRGLAALALDRQDFEEAFTLHQRLIELGEHSPELFYNAGLICQKRGRTQDAVGFYRQALAEDPQFAEALLNLGHALMDLGQEEEAHSHWRKAIREKPELAQSYFDPATAAEPV
jgi:tetratricopeptide (TPR) repeat protein